MPHRHDLRMIPTCCARMLQMVRAPILYLYFYVRYILDTVQPARPGAGRGARCAGRGGHARRLDYHENQAGPPDHGGRQRDQAVGEVKEAAESATEQVKDTVKRAVKKVKNA